MSKNMIRKDLAFGAGIALLLSSVASLPVNAAILVAGDGESPVIEVEPSSGPSNAFAVFAEKDRSFSVTATPATSVMAGGEVKAKVSDPNGTLLPGPNTTGGATIAVTDNDSLVSGLDSQFISIAASGVSDGSYYMWADADFTADDSSANEVTVISGYSLVEAVVLDSRAFFKSQNEFTVALTTASAGANFNFVQADEQSFDDSVAVSDNAIFEVTDVTEGTFTVVSSGLDDGDWLIFADDGDLTADGGDGNTDVALRYEVLQASVDSNVITATSNDDITNQISVSGARSLHAFKAPSDARASDNSYVVETGVTSAGNTAQLELVASGTTSQSATVQFWVDAFSDDLIGSTEYASNAQEVEFVERDDVSWTTSLTAPLVGATKIEATMVSSPVINGAENNDASEFQIGFTRQGSSSTMLAEASQDATSAVWSAEVDTDLGSSSYNELQSNATVSADSWAELVEPVGHAGDGTADADGEIVSIELAVDGTVTVKTFGEHGLLTGDEIEMVVNVADSDVANAEETDNVEVTVLDSKTFTYSISETGDQTAATVDSLNSGTAYTVETHETNGDGSDGDGAADRIFAGDYTARAYIEAQDAAEFSPAGAVSELGTAAVVAADTLITATATANVQGAQVNDDTDSSVDSLIRVGTESTSVTATIVDKDGDAVGSGRPVVVSVEATTDSDVTVATEDAGDSETLYTDANGQVMIDIEHSGGSAEGDKADFTVTPEGVESAETRFTMEWDEAEFTIVDLADTKSEIGGATGDQTEKRSILENGSYTIEAFVADQWYVAADSEMYRIQVTGQGVDEANTALTDGRADVTISDSGVDEDYNSVLTLQKLTSGVWGDVVAKTLNTLVDEDPSITLAVDGGSFDGESADLSSSVADKAIVERDVRQAYVSKPAYGQWATIAGKVVDDTTGVSIAGSTVTVSGPSNILFEHGSEDVASRGSITFVADGTDGEFHLNLYSTAAQEDTEITVTSMGVSETVDVTFTGQGIGEGESISFTGTPENVQASSSFQVKANVSDAFGNGVDTTVDGIRVTYTGPGIYFGNLPNETDANGNLSFSVLLGANDTGDITVKVEYDQNNDGDFTDDKDLSAEHTITVGAGAGYPAGASMKAWTVNQDDGTAKVYVKFPTIGEKVRIGHQTGGSGSYETIFVKTLDSETDSALTVNAEGSYIVRTIDLVDGTNRIRVTVGDSTEVQVRYNE